MGQVPIESWVDCGCCEPAGFLGLDLSEKRGTAEAVGYSWSGSVAQAELYPFDKRYLKHKTRYYKKDRVENITFDGFEPWSKVYTSYTYIEDEYEAGAYLVGVDAFPKTTRVVDDGGEFFGGIAMASISNDLVTDYPVWLRTVVNGIDDDESDWDGSIETITEEYEMLSPVDWMDLDGVLDLSRVDWESGGGAVAYRYRKGLYDSDAEAWVDIPHRMEAAVGRMRIDFGFGENSTGRWREIRYKTVTTYYEPFSGEIDEEIDPVESEVQTREFTRMEGEQYSDWWELPEAALGERVEYVITEYRTYHSSKWLKLG